MWRTHNGTLVTRSHNDRVTRRYLPHTCLHQRRAHYYLLTGTTASHPSITIDMCKKHGNSMVACCTALLPKKEKSLGESNKGWGEDALVQGSQVGSNTIKKLDGVEMKHVANILLGRKKTTSHNCLSDGKPMRLPGKDDQQRRRKLHVMTVCGGRGWERKCCKTSHLKMAEMISAENASEVDLTSLVPRRC